MPELNSPDGHLHLAEVLERFMSAQTPADGRQILEQHPELLGEDASFVLDRLLEALRAQGNTEALFVLQERRALLQRCREVGIDAAFS